MSNPVLEAIVTRRSVRKYTNLPVSAEDVNSILDAGRWAPSGMNNQPWRFVVITGVEKKKELAGFTHYGRVVRDAPVLVAVFLDQAACYHRVKDTQAAGACLQNMLLAAHALGLGAVWLGEILNNAERVREALGLDSSLELQAVLALGHPVDRNQVSDRRPLADLVVGRF